LYRSSEIPIFVVRLSKHLERDTLSHTVTLFARLLRWISVVGFGERARSTSRRVKQHHSRQLAVGAVAELVRREIESLTGPLGGS
jgi:hypothetical protein